jgi:hypothetical protein
MDTDTVLTQDLLRWRQTRLCGAACPFFQRAGAGRGHGVLAPVLPTPGVFQWFQTHEYIRQFSVALRGCRSAVVADPRRVCRVPAQGAGGGGAGLMWTAWWKTELIHRLRRFSMLNGVADHARAGIGPRRPN